VPASVPVRRYAGPEERERHGALPRPSGHDACYSCTITTQIPSTNIYIKFQASHTKVSKLTAYRYNHTRCVQATGDAHAAVRQHGTIRALHRSGSLKSSFNFFFKPSIHKRTGRCVLRPQDDEVLLGLPCTGLLRHRSTSDPSGSAVLVWVRHVFVVQLIHVGLLMIPSPRTKMHLLNQ